MSAYNFLKYQNKRCQRIPHSQKCAASPHYQPENAFTPEKWIPLIINHLSIKTPETTGKKPAKPEIKNKRNMNQKPQHQYLQWKQVSGLPQNTVNLFQDNTDYTIL